VYWPLYLQKRVSELRYGFGSTLTFSMYLNKTFLFLEIEKELARQRQLTQNFWGVGPPSEGEALELFAKGSFDSLRKLHERSPGIGFKEARGTLGL